jgi:hypothetical protein
MIKRHARMALKIDLKQRNVGIVLSQRIDWAAAITRQQQPISRDGALIAETHAERSVASNDMHAGHHLTGSNQKPSAGLRAALHTHKRAAEQILN